MLRMNRLVALVWMVLSLAATATAQTAPERRWSADFGIGFDNGISGNINSGAIGTYNEPAGTSRFSARQLPSSVTLLRPSFVAGATVTLVARKARLAKPVSARGITSD